MKWNIVKLGDYINILSGYPFESNLFNESNGTPVIRIRDVKRGFTNTYYKGKVDSNYLISKGDILVGMDGEFNTARWSSEPALLNQRVCKITSKDKSKLSEDYLIYFLPKKLKEIEDRTSFATVKHLSVKGINNIEIPLPPLHIQEQIADTLDKADALRRKDQELLQKYDQLAQAIFYDMFGDPVRNERGWQKKTVRDISREVKYGTSSPAEENGMYPYLRMNNITYGGELDLSSLKYINVSEKDLEKYGTQYSDLLFNRTNSKELVGKTTVVDINTPMVLAGYLIRVRLNDQANPTFVSAFLNTKEGKTTLRGMCKSIIGMANINAQELQDISIILPPKELQDDYQQKVKKVTDQKKQVLKTLEKSSHMFDKMSSVYFS